LLYFIPPLHAACIRICLQLRIASTQCYHPSLAMLTLLVLRLTIPANTAFPSQPITLHPNLSCASCYPLYTLLYTLSISSLQPDPHLARRIQPFATTKLTNHLDIYIFSSRVWPKQRILVMPDSYCDREKYRPTNSTPSAAYSCSTVALFNGTHSDDPGEWNLVG